MAAPPLTRLIVFSDDWGRHPSSSQHLVRQLLPRYPTLWVNTIGTRAPSFSLDDARKILKKLGQWLIPIPSPSESAAPLPPNLTVISPRMWPGFRTPRQRRFNARQITRALHRALGPRAADERRIVITTLPITADLPGTTAKLDVDRWVYYCVDDFSIWPGTDGRVMDEMERALVPRCDALLAVSENLRTRLSAMTDKPITLLTHGIDLDHWRAAAATSHASISQSSESAQTDSAAIKSRRAWLLGSRALPPGPIFLFWGLIDARLDVGWCQALANSGGGTLVLVGPQQAPPAGLSGHGRIVMPGPLSYKWLPAAAALADVLVMPYADLPVTRTMQPLKFKEYLATGRPVVGRRLPATEEWSDAADLVDSAEDFLNRCRRRAAEGAPVGQLEARNRLAHETWEEKAAQFEAVLLGKARAGNEWE